MEERPCRIQLRFTSSSRKCPWLQRREEIGAVQDVLGVPLDNFVIKDCDVDLLLRPLVPRQEDLNKGVSRKLWVKTRNLSRQTRDKIDRDERRGTPRTDENSQKAGKTFQIGEVGYNQVSRLIGEYLGCCDGVPLDQVEAIIIATKRDGVVAKLEMFFVENLPTLLRDCSARSES